MNILQKKGFLLGVFGLTLYSSILSVAVHEVLEVDAISDEITIVEAEPAMHIGRTVELNNADILYDIEPALVEVDPFSIKIDLPSDPDVFYCEEAPYNVPNNESGCKSYKITYMPYTAVTYKPSDQYKLLNSEFCYTDTETGIRMVDERYCIALGSGYTHDIGTKVNLVFEDGTILRCILGDCKADEHTDKTNRYHSVDGSVAEFIVDYEYFDHVSQWDSIRPKGCNIVKVVVL